MTKHLPPELMGDFNLLLLADILDKADAWHVAAGEPGYDQTRWLHPCGTPACAIGHWLVSQGRSPQPGQGNLDRMMKEFALDEKQWGSLFGYYPGYARTAAEAAAKIRGFVASRAAVQSTGSTP